LLARAEKAIDVQNAHILTLSAQLEAGGGGGGGEGGGGGDVAGQAALIAQLQEQVSTLERDLDDEREEGSRKDAELLQNQRLLQEAGQLLVEARQEDSKQRSRCDVLLREKADLVGALEGLRASKEEELGKARFDQQELEVTIETLRMENRQMTKEIAEMSGDAAPRERPTASVKSSSSSSAAAAAQADQDHVTVLSSTVVVKQDERELARAHHAQALASLCSQLSLAPPVAAAMSVFFSDYEQQQEGQVRAFEGKFSSLEKSIADASKRIRELETQRTRLERDLQSRTEKALQLQLQMEQVRTLDGHTASDLLAEKEKLHLKSLQQRLEQLVAVHRQLLRKFASLELENVDLKKKTQLRDERIRQLEGNSKGVTGNMRQQAERHVAELTNLREQIQVLRSEHQQRLEALKSSESSYGDARSFRDANGGPRAILGGGGAKSVRGGGGGVGSASKDEEGSTPKKEGGGLFSRLLGGSK